MRHADYQRERPGSAGWGHLILTNNFELNGTGPAFGELAYFILVNGKLSSPSMTVGPYAGISQRGGTNEISGGLTVINNTYYLPAGTLETTVHQPRRHGARLLCSPDHVRWPNRACAAPNPPIGT